MVEEGCFRESFLHHCTALCSHRSCSPSSSYLGYYVFDECPDLVSPNLAMEVGRTYRFVTGLLASLENPCWKVATNSTSAHCNLLLSTGLFSPPTLTTFIHWDLHTLQMEPTMMLTNLSPVLLLMGPTFRVRTI